MTQKQAAQAQAQRTVEITAQESLELVKCLLRVSVYHVSFLRGLFPEEMFKGVDMQNLDGLHIKMLHRSANEEVRMLVDWVEGGAVDAIKRKYLRKLYFGIAADSEAKHLIEEYVFSFTYDENGKVAMEFENGRSSRKHEQASQVANKTQQSTVNSVKFEVIRLIRMLVGVCQTLEKVPEERYLFMKLDFNEHTPEDYEPPFFVAAGDRAVGCFSRKPFTMKVGNVGTNHHKVALHIKSVLDSMEAVHGHSQPEPDCASVSMEDKSELSDGEEVEQAEEEGMGERLSPAEDKHLVRAKLEDLYTEPQKHMEEEEDAASCMAQAACDPVTMEKLQAYVSQRSKINEVDVLTYFSDISASQIDACIGKMVTDGVLERTADSEVFLVARVVTPLAEAEVNKKMESLAVGPSTAKPAATLPSQAGGLHEAPGCSATQSQGTVAGRPKRKSSAEGIENSEPLPNMWLDGTQPCSQAGAGPAAAAGKKTSMVEHLIHQRKKTKKEPKPEKRMLRSRMANMVRS